VSIPSGSVPIDHAHDKSRRLSVLRRGPMQNAKCKMQNREMERIAFAEWLYRDSGRAGSVIAEPRRPRLCISASARCLEMLKHNLQTAISKLIATTPISPYSRIVAILVNLGIPGRVRKAAEIGSKRFPIFCRLAITSVLRWLPI
jgi:hypothetical protein